MLLLAVTAGSFRVLDTVPAAYGAWPILRSAKPRSAHRACLFGTNLSVHTDSFL